MSSTIKNLLLVLGLLTAGFAGYLVYMERAVVSGGAATSEQELQQMLANTAVFIGYSQELQAISLDTSLFEDKRFRSLTLYTAPVSEEPAGRSNPFSNPL
jgi:hypothetical protein